MKNRMNSPIKLQKFNYIFQFLLLIDNLWTLIILIYPSENFYNKIRIATIKSNKKKKPLEILPTIPERPIELNPLDIENIFGLE